MSGFCPSGGIIESGEPMTATTPPVIRAGTAHWYENRGKETVWFLCMVPLGATYQTTWLESAAV